MLGGFPRWTAFHCSRALARGSSQWTPLIRGRSTLHAAIFLLLLPSQPHKTHAKSLVPGVLCVSYLVPHRRIRQLRQVLIQCATCKLKGPPGCCAVSLVACQRSIDVARRLEAGRCCSTSHGCGSQGWVSPSELEMERRCSAHLGCCLAARRRKSGPLWWHHGSCIQILLHLSRTQAPQDSHAGITEMPTV